MEDQERQNLPNLKICVDNTEEGELSDSDESVEQEAAIDVDDDEKNQKDKTKEVEFSVRISDLGSENKSKAKPELFTSTKKYENRDGDFITGIDLTSKEALEKKEERARRFGIEVQDQQNVEADIKGLYASLGLKEEDFNRGERGVRSEAIHMRGADNLSTQDVFRYFREFAPGGIEWIDDTSCNAVWLDPMTAARAMLKLSESYESVMEDSPQEKKTDKETTDNVTKSEKGDKEDNKTEKKEVEEGEMEVEEYDDDLDLVGEDDDKGERKMEEEKEEKKKPDSETHKSDSDDDSSKEKDTQLDDESRPDEKKVEKRDDTRERQRRRRKRLPWPPGRWRLGYRSSKTSYIFMRFATKADRKLPRAESRSKYYVKYGNPNYGGMKGLISMSRKRRYRAKTYEEELAETKAAIESQRDAREARERGEVIEKEDTFVHKVSPLKRKRAASDSGGEEELDMEAELQELLGPPVRKQRSMRMYADDEEEMRNSKRRLGSSGIMTVVAGSRTRQHVGKVKDARELIQRGGLRSSQLMMDRDNESSPEPVPPSRRSDLRMRIRTSPSVSGSDEESEDDQQDSSSSTSSESDQDKTSRPSVMSRLGPAGRASGDSDSGSGDSDRKDSGRFRGHKSRVGSDLRSRLGGQKGGQSNNSKYPSMRIEVFE